jgi:hypothetical protein
MTNIVEKQWKMVEIPWELKLCKKRKEKMFYIYDYKEKEI